MGGACSFFCSFCGTWGNCCACCFCCCTCCCCCCEAGCDCDGDCECCCCCCGGGGLAPTGFLATGFLEMVILGGPFALALVDVDVVVVVDTGVSGAGDGTWLLLPGNGGRGVYWIGILGSSLCRGVGGGGRSCWTGLGVEDDAETGAGDVENGKVDTEGSSGLDASRPGMAGRAFEKRDRPAGLGIWREDDGSMAGGGLLRRLCHNHGGVVERRNMCPCMTDYAGGRFAIRDT